MTDADIILDFGTSVKFNRAGDMPIEPRSGSAKIICARVVQSHALVNAGPRLALGADKYQYKTNQGYQNG